jgi:phosphohistidine phosphatase
MKTLVLFRHAKSDRPAGVDDVDRPLAPRGRKAAQAMGDYLTRVGEVPDAAVSSPARRAFDTLALAAAAGKWRCDLRTDETLYDAEPLAVLQAARRESNRSSRLVLVGHEPSWSETLALLIGGGEHRLATAAVAGLELDVDTWAETAPSCARLLYLVGPRLVSLHG